MIVCPARVMDMTTVLVLLPTTAVNNSGGVSAHRCEMIGSDRHCKSLFEVRHGFFAIRRHGSRLSTDPYGRCRSPREGGSFLRGKKPRPGGPDTGSARR